MKKCTIGLFSKIVTFLVFAVLFVPLTGIAFYFAFIYPQTHHEERLIFLAGLLMCVDLLGYAIYRMFYLGLVWTEYDMENTWCDNLRTDFSMGASYEKYPVSLANAWNSTNLKWLPIFLFTSANHGMNSLSIYLFPIFFEERG